MKQTPKPKKSAAEVRVGEFNEADLINAVTGFVELLKSGKAHTLHTTTIDLPEPPARAAAKTRKMPARRSTARAKAD